MRARSGDCPQQVDLATFDLRLPLVFPAYFPYNKYNRELNQLTEDTMSIKAEVLATTDLFAGLTPEQAADLAARGEERTYQQDEVIMQSGQSGNNLCIVLTGQIIVEHEDGRGLVVLGTGQGFGEMSALDAGARSATIRCATSEANLLCIPGPAILAFCEEHCCAGYRIMYNLARDLAFKLRHRNLSILTDGKGNLL